MKPTGWLAVWLGVKFWAIAGKLAVGTGRPSVSAGHVSVDRKWAAFFAGLLSLLAAHPVAAIEPFQEYRKRVESSQNIAVLKDGLFGDSVNLYNGQTSFANVDIDIPGNNALPVQLSRRYTVQIMPQGGSNWDTSLGGAGGWDIDVPYIAGTFGPVSGWKDSRCSSSWVPTVTTGFQLTEIWQGNSIHVPGGGDRTMLAVDARAPAPADGAQYRITTSDRDVFSCTPMKSGLGGEGFVMKTTSGQKYYFDVAVKRFAGLMTRSINSKEKISSSRSRVYLLASRVEDRFGNAVEYTYNASGNPTSIRSSDGREIVLTYVNGQLASASAAGRTWNYEYASVEGQPRLSAVVLPDLSRWKFSYSNALRPVDNAWDGNSDERCRVQPSELAADFALTITHPSNAVGTFSFTNRRHYRSGIHVSECLLRRAPPGGEEIGIYWVLGTPNFFDVMSLDRKEITGPAIASHAWSYDYGISPQTLWGSKDDGAAAYPCATCATEKLVTVTNPDGTRTRYRYGFLYALNEGRVLGVDTLDENGVVERSERTEYLSEADASMQGFHPSFGLIMNGDDPSTAKVRPVVRKTIVQDAVTFTSEIDKGCQASAAFCFDGFARSTRERKSSTLGSKVMTTEYYDDASRWVLGQVKRTATNGVESSKVEFDQISDMPGRVYEYGRLKQVLTYNADGTVATMSDGRDSASFDTTVTLRDWKRGTPQIINYPATPESPGGSQLSAGVNDDGSIGWVIDENSSKTCYEYDTAGRLSGIVYPTDAARTCGTTPRAKTNLTFAPVATSEYGLAANHWKRTISTGNARQVTYFDAFWRPVVDEKFDASDAAATRSITVKRYDLGGQVAFQSYPISSLASHTDALQGVFSFHDALDRITRVEQDSELGTRLITRTRYLDGFRQEVTNPRGKVTTTTFRAYEEPGTELPVLISHPEGAYTEIVRNGQDKPVILRRRNGDSSVVLDRRYVYHPVYQTLCKTIEPETGATVVDFDAAGNLLWSAAGLELPDASNCNLSEAANSGRRASRTYDARSRVTSLAFPDGRGNIAYTYQANGTPKSLVAHNDGVGANVATTTYTYDRRGLLSRELLQFGAGVSWPIDYAYDQLGNLSAQTYHSQTIDYAPNALGQPRKAGPYASGARYFPNGALKEFTYGNGVIHRMTQNARGLPERSLDLNGSVRILDDQYDYDRNGNVVAITDGATGTSQRGNRTMTYDGLDRLKRAQSSMFGTNEFGAATYAYDVLDNLTRVTINSTPTVPGRYWKYVYDGHRRLTNIVNDNTGASVAGLDYDAQGNMTQKSSSNGENLIFDFDYGNRLRKVRRAASGGAQTVSTYVYDGLGRRILDFNTGVTGGPSGGKYGQYSQSGQILQTSDDRLNTFSEYIYLGLNLVAVRERTTGSALETKYQHVDSLGSPVAVTDPTRKVTLRSEYEPYGRVLKPLDPGDGPGFSGHVLDSATGLNYMQQRYYDAEIGRFLSVDPVSADAEVGANFNRYWYASGNPYKFVDPDGRAVVVQINREEYSDTSIISSISVSSDLVPDTFEGSALEDRIAGSMGNKDPIAPGTYDAFVRTDGSKGFRLELEDVENFTNVQIHVGNDTDDVKGCFAAGETRSENYVGASRAAMNSIQAVVDADGSGEISVEVSGSANPVAMPVPLDSSLPGKDHP